MWMLQSLFIYKLIVRPTQAVAWLSTAEVACDLLSSLREKINIVNHYNSLYSLGNLSYQCIEEWYNCARGKIQGHDSLNRFVNLDNFPALRHSCSDVHISLYRTNFIYEYSNQTWLLKCRLSMQYHHRSLELCWKSWYVLAMESVVGRMLVHGCRLPIGKVGESSCANKPELEEFGEYAFRAQEPLGPGSCAWISVNALFTLSNSSKISAITLFIAETSTCLSLIRCAKPLSGSLRTSLISLKTVGSKWQ